MSKWQLWIQGNSPNTVFNKTHSHLLRIAPHSIVVVLAGHQLSGVLRLTLQNFPRISFFLNYNVTSIRFCDIIYR